MNHKPGERWRRFSTFCPFSIASETPFSAFQKTSDRIEEEWARQMRKEERRERESLQYTSRSQSLGME
jgi:hypothetical protein